MPSPSAGSHLWPTGVLGASPSHDFIVDQAPGVERGTEQPPKLILKLVAPKRAELAGLVDPENFVASTSTSQRKWLPLPEHIVDAGGSHGRIAWLLPWWSRKAQERIYKIERQTDAKEVNPLWRELTPELVCGVTRAEYVGPCEAAAVEMVSSPLDDARQVRTTDPKPVCALLPFSFPRADPFDRPAVGCHIGKAP
jgi:hypothetical protein